MESDDPARFVVTARDRAGEVTNQVTFPGPWMDQAARNARRFSERDNTSAACYDRVLNRTWWYEDGTCTASLKGEY